MAVKVPELSLLNSIDKAKASPSIGNTNSETVAIANTDISGASTTVDNTVTATSSPMVLVDKSAPSMPLAPAIAIEDNLLICVKNSSRTGDDATPERVVQQLEGAVIVTVIKNFLFFFSFVFHSICPFFRYYFISFTRFD